MPGGYTIKHRDEFESMEGSGGATWRLARKALGTSSFGFNLVEIAPGGQIPEHDEAQSGQVELFVILTGEAVMRLDGLEVEEMGEFSFDPGGLEVSTGRDNLVVRAFESLRPADGIAFRLSSDIPLARGLGSSAAAIVAGLAVADHLYELALSKEDLLARATELEGHPDNVAAAIYGGFVICGQDGANPTATRFDPPSGLEAIVVIPPEEVSTEKARDAIPAEVPLGDAVANVSAAARLVLGLQTADLDLVAAGLADRIHQQRRRDLYPRSMELVDSAREIGALGATISGAGPTVLVWTTWQDAGKVAEQLENRCGDWAEICRLPFTPHGTDVPEL